MGVNGSEGKRKKEQRTMNRGNTGAQDGDVLFIGRAMAWLTQPGPHNQDGDLPSRISISIWIWRAS
jgi:hypothetical protein